MGKGGADGTVSELLLGHGRKTSSYIYPTSHPARLVPELPGDLDQHLKDMEKHGLTLQPYVHELANLAWNWKLRAKWAAPMLLLYDNVLQWRSDILSGQRF